MVDRNKYPNWQPSSGGLIGMVDRKKYPNWQPSGGGGGHGLSENKPLYSSSTTWLPNQKNPRVGTMFNINH